MTWRTNTKSLSYSGFRCPLLSTGPYGTLTGRFISEVSTLFVRWPDATDSCRNPAVK